MGPTANICCLRLLDGFRYMCAVVAHLNVRAQGTETRIGSAGGDRQQLTLQYRRHFVLLIALRKGRQQRVREPQPPLTTCVVDLKGIHRLPRNLPVRTTGSDP